MIISRKHRASSRVKVHAFIFFCGGVVIPSTLAHLFALLWFFHSAQFAQDFLHKSALIICCQQVHNNTGITFFPLLTAKSVGIFKPLTILLMGTHCANSDEAWYCKYISNPADIYESVLVTDSHLNYKNLVISFRLRVAMMMMMMMMITNTIELTNVKKIRRGGQESVQVVVILMIIHVILCI